MARSTFFYHQKRLTQPDKHAQLKAAIHASFRRNHARYGYRRIWQDLRNHGWVVNHKLVYKLMDQMGLKAKVRPRRRYGSYARVESRIAKNVLDRNFTPDAPNTAWVSDVTEFRVAGQKVYLSPIMDLYDRSIIAHSVATAPTTAFTAASLQQAISQQQPAPGWIMHTDQGVQYQHASWRNLIDNNGGIQSMSRRGNCYDNAVMENFFGHLKAEMYHGEKFGSVKEFTAAVDAYIDWYNVERLQLGLDGCTPMQYRDKAFKALAG